MWLALLPRCPTAQSALAAPELARDSRHFRSSLSSAGEMILGRELSRVWERAFVGRCRQQTGGRDLRIGDHGAVAAQMLAGRAEQELIDEQALGVAAERQLIGRADGPVELDRLLMHGTRTAADLGFGAGDRPGAQRRRAVEAERGEQAGR